jgi:hypothetical protein
MSAYIKQFTSTNNVAALLAYDKRIQVVQNPLGIHRGRNKMVVVLGMVDFESIVVVPNQRAIGEYCNNDPRPKTWLKVPVSVIRKMVKAGLCDAWAL